MNFVESRLIGIQLDETGREVVLSLVETGGKRFALKLQGLEKLLVNEMRQQNVIEGLVHWAKCDASPALREAAFWLIAGAAEVACPPEAAIAIDKALDRVARGDLELIEITAIYGAQVIAACAAMTLQSLD